eukprot:TRINITY_DN1543_c0_g1_i2.p1 TRINITY_DN1543_c0_g1~~TRINITY_DN1543_c0_g1_i2.p1  ORF type:complete len:153 (-),score=21.74 TRINITY_DN1543_c0_g1_i2:376-834(-)
MDQQQRQLRLKQKKQKVPRLDRCKNDQKLLKLRKLLVDTLPLWREGGVLFALFVPESAAGEDCIRRIRLSLRSCAVVLRAKLVCYTFHTRTHAHITTHATRQTTHVLYTLEFVEGGSERECRIGSVDVTTTALPERPMCCVADCHTLCAQCH